MCAQQHCCAKKYEGTCVVKDIVKEIMFLERLLTKLRVFSAKKFGSKVILVDISSKN